MTWIPTVACLLVISNTQHHGHVQPHKRHRAPTGHKRASNYLIRRRLLRCVPALLVLLSRRVRWHGQGRRQNMSQQQQRRKRPTPGPQQPRPWSSTIAVLLSLFLGGCDGFTTVKPPHTARSDHRHLHRNHDSASSSSPLPHPRRRPLPTLVGARSEGYGRFSDTDDAEPSSYRASPQPEGTTGRDWQEIGNADVLVPKDVEFPLGVVHFVGGQGVGVFPKNAYGTLLEALVDAGFLVIATRVRLNEFNHEELACDVARDFRVAFRDVEALYGRGAMRRIPLFGVGHSLGAKVHVLLNCYPEVVEVAKRRKANVIISFNNFPAKDSVPFLNELRDLGLSMGDMGSIGDNLSGIARAVAGLPLVSGIANQGLSLAEEWAPKAAAAVGSALLDVPQEFKPSPQATWDLLVDQYSVRNNLVLQFKRDTIDQSPQLADTLFKRFGRDGELQYSRLDGTHVTPNTPDFRDTRQARDWASKAGLGSQGDAFVEGGARVAASTASLELDELINTLTSYLRSQSLWVRREGRWDNDEM